ncbi:MAG TPA: hypothetical protein VGP05_08945, partial [Pseudonocardia sp.]|nr:hypothetical protein [Pseudonocardia sp.]
DAAPTPVDPVVGDQPVADLHHLDDVHLFAVPGGARVLPGQDRAVGQAWKIRATAVAGFSVPFSCSARVAAVG